MIVSTPHYITDLVSTALNQNKLAGVPVMLQTIAQAVNAFGCILWQVAPGADLKANPARGRLFVLADWFADQQHDVLHDLPIDKSVTGKAILTQESTNVEDIWDPGNQVFTNDPFLSQTGIKTLCSIPIQFPDGALGAINLYRNTLPGFDTNEMSQAQQMALLVPALYQTIRHEISFDLIGKINEQLHQAELQAPLAPQPISKADATKTIKAICNLVADAFQCIEASIFLEDPSHSPDLFQLVATTWPLDFKKISYRKGDEGLTGWVLKRGEAVKIFDLAHFERDKELIQAEYEGLNWKDELNIRSTVQGILDLSDEDKLPPLSFMAVPIVKGEKIYGAIRCSVAHSGAYYFAQREVELLKLVADQISRYWSNWLARCKAHDENETWRGLVNSIKELNSYVYRELTREAPNERRIFAEAMRVTSRVIRGAEIIDVRLLDEPKQELYFAEPHGDAWKQGKPEEIQQRLERRYSVSDRDPASAGAYVFNTGKVHVIPDVKSDDYYTELFPETKRMIIAPIKVEDKKFGVLDIRGVGERDFAPHAASIGELIGQQLGMYSFLAGTIGELRATKADLSISLKELKSLQKQQMQIFQDLSHQFKTPIVQAHAQVQLALSEVTDERMQKRLWAIRGLCSKAKRVSYNTELFSALAREEQVPLKISLPLRRADLIKLLIEAAEDNQLMVEQDRAIQFKVDRESFEKSEPRNPPMRELTVDRNLLEQAVTDILDNAAKYSYDDTVVRIAGGRTSGGGFYISFLNRGLPISFADTRLSRGRGWRGDLAKDVTGEGSGIGLWIVDHIMSAHDGQLEMNQSNDKHDTLVRLIFPSWRVI
jgi:signal transduction histidine kinase